MGPGIKPLLSLQLIAETPFTDVENVPEPFREMVKTYL